MCFPSLSVLNAVLYLCVLFVAAVDLCNALLGSFSRGRGGESLLHTNGTVPQSALDAKRLIKLVHLNENTGCNE